MQKDTGELLTEKEIKKLTDEGGKGPDDFVATEVTIGMKIKVGNILCRVRKITRKDFILRPIR